MIWFIVGLFFGIVIGWENKKCPIPANDTEVEKLREQIAYYKGLCLWHVEEKEKLQKIKEQYERECG